VDWEPTENQEKALAFAWDHDYDFTVSALCEQVGVSRTAWYHWQETPAFLDWWAEGREAHAVQNLPKVWSAMLRKAEAGDVRAARLVMERFDPEYQRGGRQAKGAPSVVICFDMSAPAT